VFYIKMQSTLLNSSQHAPRQQEDLQKIFRRSLKIFLLSNVFYYSAAGRSSGLQCGIKRNLQR